MKEDKKKDSNKIKVRLNKYISNSGLCSRREADRYILKGLVSVNNKIVKDLGTKVFFDDKVELRNKIIEKSFFNYFLLNKPLFEDEYYVLEVNSVPSWKSIQELESKNLSKILVEDFINNMKKNVF